MMKPLELRALFPPPPAETEAPRARPEDYDDRPGYDSEFLGDHADFEAPLPLLQDRADMVRVERPREGRPFELCYEHFSVVMRASRRFCCVTGVNIAGNEPFFHPKRPGWKTDPRVPAAVQVNGSFYVPTPFDRGHMVRRLDPVWGEQGGALLANADTHHYTNSCPQVHSFNDVTWGDLEDWVLSQEQSRDSRGSVFTGPIFSDSDPVYQGVRVPVDFYKIIVVVDDDTGKLSVTAFRQSQQNVMPEGAALERPFDPGRFVVNQVTLRELEQDTGLDFGRLRLADVLATHPVIETAGLTGPIRIPLASARDAVLWAR